MSKKVTLESIPSPIIVLVRPQIAENIGMVARAMMNCTLSELRLVTPKADPLSEKAIAASSGAQEILEHAKVYQTLEGALADTEFVLATTARPRDMTKPLYHPEKGIELCKERIQHQGKVAILFGAERTGLENDEIIPANGIIEIPLNPKHCSLNLSQAVLLIGYTWFRKTLDHDNTHFVMGGSDIANKKEVSTLLDHLEQELKKRGYFRLPEKNERMSRNLRNIFERIELTKAEIKTLHGVILDLIKQPKGEKND